MSSSSSSRINSSKSSRSGGGGGGGGAAQKIEATSAIGDSRTKDIPVEAHNQGPKVKSGRGSITTSQCVCQGHGTAFTTELRAGDAVIARTQSGTEEMRVVTMVLSPVSISLSSAFSYDLKTPTPFSYINKPRDDKREKAAKVQKARQEQREVEERAMGSYGAKGEIIYREKTEHGGYRIRKEKAKTEMTRSDLLAVRATKKSDRYC
mmetsp:Transcript_46472/g.98579  ORF Transcript_46472/g.98579 Transcript_46472/m.98579 type:complete len:207 (+) Transcript_46472:45-665(+)